MELMQRYRCLCTVKDTAIREVVHYIGAILREC